MDRSPPPQDSPTAAPDYPRRPRWVVVAVAIGTVVVIGVVILLLSGGHGPGRHSGEGSTSSHSAPSHGDP